MANIIQLELKEAKNKMIEEVSCGEHQLAKLTRDNVAIVEAMIRNDSAYIRSSNAEAEPKYKNNGDIEYGGSSAYWLTLLKSVLIDGKANPNYSYEEIIRGAVASIDRENSTHINADGCGRNEIVERVCGFKRDEIIKSLQKPNYKEMILFKKICEKTSV